MSTDDKRRIAAASFVVLLALALVWPSPVVEVNDLCCRAPLPIDDLSFLGREAPSWDIVFWCLVGIFVIAIVQSFEFDWSDFGEACRMVRRFRPRKLHPPVLVASAIAALGLVAVTLRWFDEAVTAWAEQFDSVNVESAIRYLNRLGGGMNPAMIVFFFVVLGVVAHYARWTRYGVAMALAGLSAGIVAQAIKFAVARLRPELWLGPFVRAHTGATSFPSGHTIGAFALAGVLLFASRNFSLRAIAMLLAIAIGVARILAFRHWASDVLASALLGLLAAWVAVHGVSAEDES